MKRVAFASAIAILLSSFLFAAQPKGPAPITLPIDYAFVTINYPGSGLTELYGINNYGYIVGTRSQVPTKGFTRLPNGTFAPEAYPGSSQTGVSGINNNDPNFETSGGWVDKAGIFHGFLRNSNAWVDVDYPGTTYNELGGLNDNDVAAGYYLDGANHFHPYIYSQPGNQFTPLVIPGSDNATAAGINDSNEIVGTYVDSSDVAHGFLLSPSFTALNYPTATNTYANGINNYGAIVGYFYDASGLTHGFLYYLGSWQQLDDPNFVGGETYAWGINDNFDIVGFDITDAGVFGFEATPE
jgi:probable HAF family extracellular repeat protein